MRVAEIFKEQEGAAYVSDADAMVAEFAEAGEIR
jgi:hypothetical protein